jgi:peptidoglycan/LPS O-acetylase OafA/YrhL
VLLVAVLFMVVGNPLRILLHPLEVYGRTPFFFYVIHIPLLALVTKRTGLLPWKEGDVGTALLAWVALLIIMYPLCLWFGRLKSRTRNELIRMM